MKLSNNLVAQRVFNNVQVDFYANSFNELYQKMVIYLMVITADKGEYCYIGQAGYGVYKRMCSHCSDAFKRTDNSKKANAIKKYKRIKAYILKVCANEIELDAEERKYIVQYHNDNRYARCLNTLLIVNPNKERITLKSIDPKYKVEQYSLAGKYIKTFASIREAATLTGVKRNLISRVINKKATSAGGYQWKRVSDNSKMEPVLPHCARIRKNSKEIPLETREVKKKREQESRGIKIEQYDLNGNLIAIHPSLHETARQSGVNIRGISFCCSGKYKQCNGFQFKKSGSSKAIYRNLLPSGEYISKFNVATKGKPVGGFNERDELVEKYDSKRQAEKAHNAYGLINNIKSNTKRFGLYWRFL